MQNWYKIAKDSKETELEMGIEIEKEHKPLYDILKDKFGDEFTMSLEEFCKIIAKHHLKEMDDYYTKLKEMEDKHE